MKYHTYQTCDGRREWRTYQDSLTRGNPRRLFLTDPSDDYPWPREICTFGEIDDQILIAALEADPSISDSVEASALFAAKHEFDTPLNGHVTVWRRTAPSLELTIADRFVRLSETRDNDRIFFHIAPDETGDPILSPTWFAETWRPRAIHAVLAIVELIACRKNDKT